MEIRQIVIRISFDGLPYCDIVAGLMIR